MRPKPKSETWSKDAQLDDHADAIEAILAHLGLSGGSLTGFPDWFVQSEKTADETTDQARDRLIKEQVYLNNMHAINSSALSDEQWERRLILNDPRRKR